MKLMVSGYLTVELDCSVSFLPVLHLLSERENELHSHCSQIYNRFFIWRYFSI